MIDLGVSTADTLFDSITTVPFSFIYDGTPSQEKMTDWQVEHSEHVVDTQHRRTTLIYTDKETGLEIRCETTHFTDYPAVEWVLYFRNTGSQDTPIIENIQALDMVLSRAAAGPFVVHHAVGSDAKITDFTPSDTKLGKGRNLHIVSGHMSSIYALPFFNVEANSEGIIAAIGWSAKWKADFTQESDTTLHVQAGMDSTHLRLHPGEEIRTPRMLVLFWKGDRIDAHNQWRRLLLGTL
jgi:alpha-galactosidase